MKIALAIHSMGCGGAERVMAILANRWAATGHDVTLITLDSVAGDFFPLHAGVRRLGLGLAGGSRGPLDALLGNCRRLMALRRAIRGIRPDAVLSFMDRMNVLAILASRGIGCRVVVAERTDPRSRRIGRAWSALRRVVYPFADALVVQTEAVRPWAEAEMAGRRRVEVIPNPLERLPAAEAGSGADAAAPGRPRTLCSVGRLIPSKGFDRLLRAFAACAPEFPDWRLVILGEGGERKALEALAAGLGVADRVSMPGQSSDVLSELPGMDLFVMTSAYEGFPNALVEAMASGLPVISFDCPSGPGEIIRHGVDGFLVSPGDMGGLVSRMKTLMGAEPLRRELGRAAAASAGRFAVDTVLARWQAVIAPDPAPRWPAP